MDRDQDWHGADWELVWPRDLLVTEVSRLIRVATAVDDHSGTRFPTKVSSTSDWQDQVILLLDEAFAGPEPQETFREAVQSQSLTGTDFLLKIDRRAPDFRDQTQRRGYWPQRRATISQAPADTWDVVTAGFVGLVEELEGRGYLERVFPSGCVDDRSFEPVDPSSVFEKLLGTGGIWPLRPSRSRWNEDLFFGIVEVIHDLVARPRRRWWHDYGGEWHYTDFAIQPARLLYRWQVNRLLDGSEISYRLADAGEDEGRLVAVPSDVARGELLQGMATRDKDDPVRHAVALFRARDAGTQGRRSAVLALAGVLEERRCLLKTELLSNDEKALFQIANSFGIRHQRMDQKTDYQPIFLDWLFWWYLATVELTDRLLARSVRHLLSD